MSSAPEPGALAGRLERALPAAQEGHAWALRVLYDDLAPRVQAYLRRRGALEPEDLTSEVFLAVLPRLDTISGGVGGLRTLLFSVAHARLVDELRRRARSAPTHVFDPQQDSPAVASAEDEALQHLGTERVRALLADLPADQRDVLLLRVVGDLTVDQTAEVMGRSPGAVKQLQRRGLLTLRGRVEAGRVTL